MREKVDTLDGNELLTCLVVRKAQLLAPTDKLPHCLDEDSDGPRAQSAFRDID